MQGRWAHFSDFCVAISSSFSVIPLKHRPIEITPRTLVASKVGGHRERRAFWIGNGCIGRDCAGLIAWASSIIRISEPMPRKLLRFMVGFKFLKDAYNFFRADLRLSPDAIPANVSSQ
jgi:hypothetical protein